MKYHGNYCGPYWSAGKRRRSVRYGVGPDAIDEFDESCRRHDDAYARNSNLKDADYTFYKENIGRGIKRSAAALAVGAQGLFRSSEKKQKLNNNEIMAPTGRSRSRSMSVVRGRSRSMPATPRTPRARSRSSMSISARRGSRSASSVSFASSNTGAANLPKSSSGGRMGRKGTKSYARKNAKYAIHGATLNIEYSGQTSDVNTVFIGHATVSQEYLSYAVAQSILRNF